MQFRFTSWISVGSVCLGMAALYFLIYGNFGYADTDQGYIQGLSWRIVQGEIPYQDFLYVRPPFSLYIHSLPLLFPAAVWVERLLFYVFIAISVWVTTRTLQDHFDFRPIGISPMVFAAMSFIFCVHNYPPMPWHTVDGILFLSLGIYSISRAKGFPKILLGIFLLFLAALCKQVYYPILFLAPFFIGIIHKRRYILPSILALIGMIGLILLTVWLMAPELPHLFWEQTMGSSGLGDLWQAGFLKYRKAFVFLFIPAVILWRVQENFIFPVNWKNIPGFMCWAAFLGILGLNAIKAMKEQNFVEPSYGYPQALFLIAFAVALKGTWINLKAYSVLLMFIIIAWCSGISWGYQHPILFCTPLLFAFLHVLYEDFEFRVPRYFYGLLLIFVAWIFAFMYQFPYRDSPRSEENFHAGEVFDPLWNIYTGKRIHEKLLELKTLEQSYGQDFTVLPGFPSAHYLTKNTNPFPGDWAHNAEILYDKNKEELLNDLKAKVRYVFLENNKLERIQESGHYGSKISVFVGENWQKIEIGTHFTVYQNPGL